jgi:5-methylcytosine-specific restriction enzyme A
MPLKVIGENGLPVAIKARPSKIVDTARLDSELLAFVSAASGREAIRVAVAHLLAKDPWEKSRALLKAIAPGTKPASRAAMELIDFEAGQIYERAEIHARFGGQGQGGICTPANYPIIILFSGASGESYGYRDEWSADGVFLYSGEGQRGDMQFVRGNKTIRDHARNGKELLLFQSLGKDTRCRYVGQFSCTSWETAQGPDEDARIRQIIRFHLVPVDIAASVPALPADGELRNLTMEQLRQKAYELGVSAPTAAAEGGRNYYHRSEIVKAYVLARANGVCQSCKACAPFTRADGSPYLEPHHVRRLSDGGPDHPRFVGGICPTCHRRIHHGADRAAVNEALMAYLEQAEAED